MHAALTRLLLVAATIGWLGCGRVGAPPVAVTYRDSLLGIGKVLQVTNQGKVPLTGIEVRVETPEGDVKHHELASLAAGETTEVGWKKLAGFEIPSRSQVSIHCSGYLLPYRTRLP
jgi:hypothetical protein